MSCEKFLLTLTCFAAAMHCAQASEQATQVARPKWILVAQMLDAVTGEQIAERELHGTNEPQGGWDNPMDCIKEMIEIGPIPAYHGVATVIACRKVGPQESST